MLTVGTVVLGVTDVARSTEFWCRALEYTRRDAEWDDTWVTLAPAAGGAGTHLSLMLSETSPQKYPRVHLDLYADDQQAEVRRLLELGATEVDWDMYDEHPGFVVLADPDGNRFCVIDKSEG